MKKVAIIGTSTGQKALYQEAHKIGYTTIGFSWQASEEMLSLIDTYYQISILEKDEIVAICRKEGVCGVVSNGSELTIQISSYVAGKLNLRCTPYETILKIQDKHWVREQTKGIEGLCQTGNFMYAEGVPVVFPCVVKPITGGGKRGVSFASDAVEFSKAIEYAKEQNSSVIVEDYIKGQEISVESISYNGIHHIIQITDKETSGPPHFVELSHHQPSLLPDKVQEQIRAIIPKILTSVGFTDGASHIEMKTNERGLYLIEINPRGGGDEISNQLVRLSTDFNYIGAMLQVAVSEFEFHKVSSKHSSGIYFLTKQTKERLPFFLSSKSQAWYVGGQLLSLDLIDSKGNAEKNGYVIYQSDKRIKPIL